MNSNADIAQTNSIAASIASNVARLSEALNNHMRNSFQPDRR